MSRESEVQTAVDIDRHHAVQLLKQMLRIRRFEEKAAELYTATKIRGFLHLYIGEAVRVNKNETHGVKV
jgi:pyruvate dehydrogenase E1 component alpha subunit